MSLITLTTDFGITDPFVAIMKGVILSIYPKAQIIDITHNIPPQDIAYANWVIRCSFHYFPKDTIHVCVVDPGVGTKRKPILLETTNHFFIGPDNGIFTSILEQQIILNAIELNKKEYWLKNISQTFHGREIFSPVAAHLASGIKPKDLGRSIDIKDLVRLPLYKTTKTNNGYVGSIQQIDNFGNLITNIPDTFVKKNIQGKINNHEFIGLAENYTENESNKLFAIIGSHGFLELSVSRGSAAKLTNAKVGDEVEVIFNGL